MADMGISFSVDGVVQAVSGGDEAVWRADNGRFVLAPRYAIDQAKLTSFAARAVPEYSEPVDASLRIEDSIVQMTPHSEEGA